MNLNKVIIWGHTLHDHTHSYIHNAFYRTFKYLGYKTYWFSTEGENNYLTEGSPDNFENSLFIVHGLVSHKLPLNNTSIYIAHNVEFVGNNRKIPKKHILLNTVYSETIGILPANILTLQVYTKKSKTFGIESDSLKCTYYIEPPHSSIFMPWATDLFPEEIDANINNLENFEVKNISNFIGMPLEHNSKLSLALKKYNIRYQNSGGTFDINSKINKSVEENMKLIQESIIAPALQTEWQIDNGYIPCRIFKNISYGKMGITNNPTVNELFDNKLIYSASIPELVKEGLEFEKREDKYEIIKRLMREVRDKHTYVNRINFLLEHLIKYHDVVINKI